MITKASKSGFAFDRWKRGLTIMLEKTAGVIRVDKLWAILLMEADFNFHNKEFFGCLIVNKAEEEDILNEDKYGS